jgi:RNA polymerase sigma-70 factor (ECF subfamily)
VHLWCAGGVDAWDLIRSSLVERQMQKLSEPARTVFYLSRREYLSYKQIAERLGISTSTVEYHISNSLRTLRRELL